MKAAIGYLRVSTQEQGRSGLSLAAQRLDIEAFGALANPSPRPIGRSGAATGRWIASQGRGFVSADRETTLHIHPSQSPLRG